MSRVTIHATLVDLLDPARSEDTTISMLRFMNQVSKRVVKGITSTDLGNGSAALAMAKMGKGKVEPKPCEVVAEVDYQANVADLLIPKRCVGNAKKWAFAPYVEQVGVTNFDIGRPRNSRVVSPPNGSDPPNVELSMPSCPACREPSTVLTPQQ